MNDKKLLELAAKAAGIDLTQLSPYHADDWIGYWNPLTDDGDALRLAVKLGMSVFFNRSIPITRAGNDVAVREEPHGNDPYAATRRAIVRAAAKIGKEMK